MSGKLAGDGALAGAGRTVNGDNDPAGRLSVWHRISGALLSSLLGPGSIAKSLAAPRFSAGRQSWFTVAAAAAGSSGGFARGLDAA
jgi:hypothetical protein